VPAAERSEFFNRIGHKGTLRCRGDTGRRGPLRSTERLLCVRARGDYALLDTNVPVGAENMTVSSWACTE
jgi:hypothetical protein